MAFGLDGLLPHHTSTMEQQSARVYANIVRKDDALEKFIGLAALQQFVDLADPVNRAQVEQEILPAGMGLGPTKVWSYGPAADPVPAVAAPAADTSARVSSPVPAASAEHAWTSAPSPDSPR